MRMYLHINMYMQTHTPKHVREGKVNYDDSRHLMGITMTAIPMPLKLVDPCHTVIGIVGQRGHIWQLTLLPGGKKEEISLPPLLSHRVLFSMRQETNCVATVP